MKLALALIPTTQTTYKHYRAYLEASRLIPRPPPPFPPPDSLNCLISLLLLDLSPPSCHSLADQPNQKT